MVTLADTKPEEWEISFMRHLTPAQRETSKRWDYIISHNGISYPIGYCGGWTHPDKLQKDLGEFPLPDGHRKQMLDHQKQYHTNGHETEQDACECYQDYLLDFHMSIHDIETQQFKCVICDVWTDRIVHVESHRFQLCPRHSTRETIKGLFRVGKSWES